MSVNIVSIDAPPQQHVRRSRLYDYDAAANLIYEGWAPLGSTQEAAVWTIRKYVYVTVAGVSCVSQSLWAVGDQNAWVNRAVLAYA